MRFSAFVRVNPCLFIHSHLLLAWIDDGIMHGIDDQFWQFTTSIMHEIKTLGRELPKTCTHVTAG